MSVLIVLIVVSVLVAGTFLTLFVLSVKKGQYDDAYTPSVRMLFDDGTVGLAKGASGTHPAERRSGS